GADGAEATISARPSKRVPAAGPTSVTERVRCGLPNPCGASHCRRRRSLPPVFCPPSPRCLVRSLALAFVLVLTACGGGDPTGDGGDGGYDNFNAEIDGTGWNAEFPPSGGNSAPGLYVFTAMRTTGNAYTMSFTLSNITGPGTYPL